MLHVLPFGSDEDEVHGTSKSMTHSLFPFHAGCSRLGVVPFFEPRSMILSVFPHARDALAYRRLCFVRQLVKVYFFSVAIGAHLCPVRVLVRCGTVVAFGPLWSGLGVHLGGAPRVPLKGPTLLGLCR